MFTKIKSIITNHAAQIDSLKAVFLEQKKKCYESKDYTTTFKDKMYGDLKATYNADRIAFIEQNKGEVERAFEEIFEKLENAITAEIGQETIAELQVLLDAAVSEFEINAYAKKFAGKYKALRIINDIAKKNAIPFTYVRDSDIIGDLNYLKTIIVQFFNEYQGRLLNTDDYTARTVLYYAENETAAGNPFVIIEAEFNDFIQPEVGTKSYEEADK